MGRLTASGGWGRFCLFMMSCCFGSMIPFAKAAMEHGMPAFTLSGMRMWGAAAFFWLFTLAKPSCPVPFRDLLGIILAGFLSIALDQGLFILGLSFTSPVDAGVICTLIPVFAMVLAMVFKGLRPSRSKMAGIAIGLAGAVTMVLSAGGGGR
ncbi:MAG: DMT family transporter, partial [Mailhella sp.]|nr:DMT family transporter [Mailhella sp.]